MTNFQNALLNRLLDKYEKSTSNRKIKISCNSKEELFKSYFDKKAYLYRPEIENDVSCLVNLGFICSDFNADGELKSVVLNSSEICRIYDCLGRTSKTETDGNYLNFINLKLNETLPEVTKSYLTEMKRLIETNGRHKLWFDCLEDLKRTVSFTNAICDHFDKDEELLRNFSKHNFGDSKILERYGARLVSVFNTFGDCNFVDFDSLLQNYAITRNPLFIQIKGPVSVCINEQKVNVEKFGFAFCIPEQTLDDVIIYPVYGKNIITIENLTTFNTAKDANSIFIYLGGFSCKAKTEFLKKLKEVCQKCTWYHFSDIDVGGFRIFHDLKTKTGIDFKSLLMGVSELKKYKSQCLSLSEFDKKNLSAMRTDSNYELFWETIDFMLKNNIKLEQESIDFSVQDSGFDSFSHLQSSVSTVVFEIYSTWYSSSVHKNYSAEVKVSFSVEDKSKLSTSLGISGSNITPETVVVLIKAKLERLISGDFDDYVTAEEYYEPVVEDYCINLKSVLENFCRDNGLKLVDYDLNTDETDYISNGRYY